MSSPSASDARATNRLLLRRIDGPMSMPVKRKRLVCDEEDEEFIKAMDRGLWKTEGFSSEKGAATKEEAELPVGAMLGPGNSVQVNARWLPDEGRVPILPEAPVYFPDEEEFNEPIRFIRSIRESAEKYGICRIVPPRSWRPPCSFKDEGVASSMKFSTRLQKVHKLQKRTHACPSSFGSSSTAGAGIGFETGPDMSLAEFMAYAEEFKRKYMTTEDELAAFTVEDVEGEYWRIMESPTEQVEVLYGADLDTAKVGSGFPKPKPGPVMNSTYEKSGWNLNNIARNHDSLLRFEDKDISGVIVPWLYVGMSLSSFCWHVEDHYLYSVNYMHFGDPKVWYGVPRNSANLFEDSIKKNLAHLFKAQPDLLQKLVTQFSPAVLKNDGVPVYRTVQRPGDFIVTFPRAYHCGLNTGFNCAEAVNFAPIDWLAHGQSAVEYYQKIRRRPTISHDKVLFSAVLHCINPSMANARPELLDITMLLKALKARIQTEHSRRTWRERERIKSRKMDSDFNVTEDRECLHCRFDLYLSAVACDGCPGRYVCLDHVDQLCLCACQRERKYALYRYELRELYSFQTALEKLLKLDGLAEEDSDPSEFSSPSVMSTHSRQASVQAATVECTSSGSKKDLGRRLQAKPSQECAVVLLSDDDQEEDDILKSPDPRQLTSPNCSVELLDVGTVTAAGWCNKDSIFPAGFKSRVPYYNFTNLSRMSYYISEIVDCGTEEPYFKVTLENSPHSFVDVSADLCWRSVQRRLNFEIQWRRKLGSVNVPSETPVEEIEGMDMFGLTHPAIKKAVEALDKKRVCSAYWNAGDKSISSQRPQDLLRNLFRKGDKNELWALHKVLGSEWGSDTWKQGFQSLADVLQGLFKS